MLYFLSEHPKITTQPRDFEDVFLGTTVTLSVQAPGLQAIGAQPLRYQWERKETLGWHYLSSGTSGERIQGVQTAILTIDKVQKSDEGQYQCIVSDSVGSVKSQPATLRLAGEKHGIIETSVSVYKYM